LITFKFCQLDKDRVAANLFTDEPDALYEYETEKLKEEMIKPKGKSGRAASPRTTKNHSPRGSSTPRYGVGIVLAIVTEDLPLREGRIC